jgi:hypothetical protein
VPIVAAVTARVAIRSREAVLVISAMRSLRSRRPTSPVAAPVILVEYNSISE